MKKPDCANNQVFRNCRCKIFRHFYYHLTSPYCQAKQILLNTCHESFCLKKMVSERYPLTGEIEMKVINKYMINANRKNLNLVGLLKEESLKGVLQGNRKLWKGVTGKRIVFFPSIKNKGQMPCESRLEADNCLDLEFNSKIKSYRTQPFTIKLNKKDTYTPDTLHIDNLGSLTVREVKFSGALECNMLRKRLDYINSILLKQGISFVVLTEKQLQISPKVENRKYLYRCSHLHFHDLQLNQACNLLPDFADAYTYTLGMFRNDCQKLGLEPLIADKLLFTGMALYKQETSLNSNSLVWRPGESK